MRLENENEISQPGSNIYNCNNSVDIPETMIHLLDLIRSTIVVSVYELSFIELFRSTYRSMCKI